MATFHDLTTAQLKQAIHLREQISSLQKKLDALFGGSSTTEAKPKVERPTGNRTMPASARAKIAAAQKARWAKVNGTSSTIAAAKKSAPAKPSPTKKGGITAAGRAKLAAAMRARWAAKKKAAAVRPKLVENFTQAGVAHRGA